MTSVELGLDRTSFNAELKFVTSCDLQRRKVEHVAGGSNEDEYAIMIGR
jgi:hypothetical protein